MGSSLVFTFVDVDDGGMDDGEGEGKGGVAE
jgi:hypothetical protein